MTVSRTKNTRRMNSSSFPVSPRVAVVADASVIINLNATEDAAAIIGAFPNPFLVTDNVRRELSLGKSRGHLCGERLEALIGQGVFAPAELGPADQDVYRSLVEGGIRGDPGTTAKPRRSPIPWGMTASRSIDERKAKRICAARFPDVLVMSTVEMLLHGAVGERLGESGQCEAIVLGVARCAHARPPPRAPRSY